MEMRRSVMERPNLSERPMSLVVRRWSFAGHRAARLPTTNDQEPTTALERELISIIESRRAVEVSRFHRLFDGGLGERGHDFVPGGVGVKTVFRQIALQQALFVDHGAEIVEVNASRRGAIVLDPGVEFK